MNRTIADKIAAARAAAAQDHLPPRIALLDALGLRALVMPVRDQAGLRTEDHIDFIAVGPDRRLRCGSITVVPALPAPERVPEIAPDDRFVHACLAPEGPDALAAEIARAVALAESGTVVPEGNRNPPFTLSGWSPATRSGSLRGRPGLASRRDIPGFEWLAGEPLSDAAANRLWDEGLAPLAAPEDVEAAALFEVPGFVDYAAFDACRRPDAAGAARRAFARANPLVANAALRDPAALAMVDAGARLKDVLDALSGGPEVHAWPPREGSWRALPKRTVLDFSGRALVPGSVWLRQEDALAAAAELPRDWLPATRAEAEAFTALCGLARAVYDAPGQETPAGMWRTAMAGAGGRWVEYAERVLAARGPLGGNGLAERLALMHADAVKVRHFARDILVPVATVHGDGTAVALAGHVLRGGRPTHRMDALKRFGRDAFLAGMALPAFADFVRRQEAARAAIRAVVAAYPSPCPDGPPRLRGRGRPVLTIFPNGMVGRAAYARAGIKVTAYDSPSWPEVEPAAVIRSADFPFAGTVDGEGRPATPVSLTLYKVHADYAFEAPGAVEAMLDAWRRALPRRWRKLDARGLAAAFDAEAAAFAGAHGIEPGAKAPILAL